MARIRALKPEFFRSPDVAQLDFPVRLFYQALWCWADDFGIGETNIYGLLGFAFPDSDNFTAQDVRGFCADCARILRVQFYAVRGRHFYAIPSWEKHQKMETRSSRRRNPGPDDPAAVPDQRFHLCADSAPESRRKSGAKTALEHRNIGTGNIGTGEPPYPPQAETTGPRLPATRTKDGAGATCQRIANLPSCTAGAYRIAKAFDASLTVPVESGVLSEIATQIDKCLVDDIPPPAIADGIKAWAASDSFSPTQIPRFVLKAATRSRGVGKPTIKAVGYDAAVTEILAELEVSP